MKILVTGGTGYIGSHTVIELLAIGHDVIVVDNLSNSKKEVVERIEDISRKKVEFHKIDLCDLKKLDELFSTIKIDTVMHFAGLKSVGESVSRPLSYYRNNIISTINLTEVMQKYGIKKLIFSSSATVYGTPSELPLKESSKTGSGITNPYGQTKFMIEQMLCDISVSDNDWKITNLRYFNPIGAHESGRLGEDPNGIPNNLLPFVSQVAIGKLDKLKIFGDNYDTPDGTGVRDYIHVVDLAKGHVAALNAINKQEGLAIYNLGTGKGVSVLEIVKAFERSSGIKITYEIINRRPGDIASCYADCTKAFKELGWKTEKSLEDACRDSWRWQQFISASV